MKIIHCADLHLDSAMGANLDREKAKERKQELLVTFMNMVKYAAKNNVSAIIIAGDMFDTSVISARARNIVYDIICGNPHIDFYYLKGNHDRDGFLDSIPEIPENLKLFGTTWTAYYIRRICIAGVELTPENSDYIYSQLELSPEDFNIVVLHGQTSEYRSRDRAEIIDLGSLRNKNIDYLALGHIHSYKKGELPPRGQYCYPGCLEGRGFDECGSHGFELIEIDERTMSYTSEFIYFAKRTLFTIKVDITGCLTNLQIRDRITQMLTESDCMEDDLIKIVLTGNVDIDCEKNMEILAAMVGENYYYVKVVDESGLYVDYRDYAYDATLKGEFIRILQADNDLTESDRTEIIRCGIAALNGEELDNWE